MEWLTLLLLVPAIIVPIVLLCGFAGCDVVFGLTPPPPPPVLDTPTPRSPSRIKLTWSHSAVGVFTFAVERAREGGTFEPVPAAQNLIAMTTFTDTNLEEATAYFYRVTATPTNTNRTSDPSNEAGAITLRWDTIFSATLTEDRPEDRTNHTGVLRINAGSFLPGVPGGPAVRITMSGHSTVVTKLAVVYVSRVAAPGAPGNPIPDEWDPTPASPDGGLTEVKFGGASGVTLQPGGPPRISDDTEYTLEPGQDLLIAFDTTGDPTLLRRASPAGPKFYFKGNAAEAAVPNRAPGYSTDIDAVYVVERIEVAV